jgi:hypothetical protein
MWKIFNLGKLTPTFFSLPFTARPPFGQKIVPIFSFFYLGRPEKLNFFQGNLLERGIPEI